jgi:hypothetical protein
VVDPALFTKAVARDVRTELDDLASWLRLGDVVVV